MRRERLKSNLDPTIQQRHESNNRPEPPIRLRRPVIVGYMSVDVQREFHHNLSQLKYLTSIPDGRLHFDLNHNIDKAVKRTTDDNNEKITLLLKFILNQKHHLIPLINEDILFISYRRTLISVMCNVYNCTPVSIIATLFNNCIYLHLLELPQERLRRQACREQDKFCAWGYKFEQYMLSDLPNIPPDIEKPVLENEEFSLYYTTKLGNHRLFYGAQIDGMLATSGPAKTIPNENDVESNLYFLRNNRYVELKTTKEMQYRPQIVNFKKYKMLRCWCQCFLAGLKGLLMGYRNDDGIVHRVEWFNTAGIVRFCKGKWDPQITISHLDRFLQFVKDSFNSEVAIYGNNYDPNVPITLKFDIDDQQRYSVMKTTEEEHIILPSWYTENITRDDD